MTVKSLPALAAELSLAPDAAAALRSVSEELTGEDHRIGLVLLTVDPRRNSLVNDQLVAALEDPTTVPPYAMLALDHLPPAVQYAVLAGQRFVEVGDQSSQYGRLLGVDPGAGDFRLLLKGIVFEGALAAVLALFDAGRRSTSKLLDRVAPLTILFELAYARFYERDARFEAVSALHEITTRMRAEHASAVAGLEREVERLRAAQRAGTSDVIHKLRDAVAAAEKRAIAAEQRLVAVEGQVVSAVDRLERSHVQLHQQDSVMRQQAELIRQLEARLSSGQGLAESIRT
ncbi:MAG: hypothetical protein M3Z30_01695 [Gemmatimonadota bacterium]|nr:hypothetical protein [Gemmatimonadota bacterium]